MEVTLKDYEIYSYSLSLRVEVEGERYLVDVAYDNYDGYEVTFFDEQGIKIAQPEWADKLERENDDSLGYILETSTGKRVKWVELEKVSA